MKIFGLTLLGYIGIYYAVSAALALESYLKCGRWIFPERGLPIWYSLGNWAPKRLRAVLFLRKTALIAFGAFSVLAILAIVDGIG